jgi:hypothetical protein
MEKGFKKVFVAAGIWAALLITVLMPSAAEAYGPLTMYTPSSSAPFPGVLYARAMQTSNGKMYATFEQYTTKVSSFPIFESLDSGLSWNQVGDVKDTHKNWGMRWEPHLYQLPQAIGDMPKGTLLAAGLVLPYVIADSCEIDLYKSNDEGRSWTYVSTVAVGTKPDPGSDPVWEPFLMVADNKLYCFYSDERDPDTKYSQKLVHQSSTDGIHWSSVVDDVAISGERPGMVVVTQMPNGNYLMIYEIIANGNGSVYYKISSNIESWNASNKGTYLDGGTSPYAVTMDGSVILSSAGNGNLYTNDNNGEGSWKQISSPVGTGYSRCLVPLNNGRLFVINAGWNNKSGLNSGVIYGDLAFGCASNAIVPYMQVNGGEWRNTSADTVDAGATIVIGPQPVAASGWSWSGPNGFTATTREITLSNIVASQAGTYTATYTNSSGCKSTQKFTLTVNAATRILTIHAKGSRGSVQVQLLTNNDLNLQLFDKNVEVRILNLEGKAVYKKQTSANELVIPGLKAGVYIIDVMQNKVLLERKSFVVE